MEVKETDIFIKTDRVTLRRISDEDFKLGIELFCNEEIMKYLGTTWKKKEALDSMREWKKEWGNSNYYYGIISKNENEDCIGIAGISENTNPTETGIEIAWFVKKEHQNNGYATEVCNAILNKVFIELKKDRVFAEIGPCNFAARKVLEKIGFMNLGDRSNEYAYLPEMKEQSFWEITKHNWESRKKRPTIAST